MSARKDPVEADVLRGIARHGWFGRFDEPGLHQDIAQDYPLATRPVHPSQHPLYLGYAMWHCRYRQRPGGLEAMQLLWPDQSGVFPYENGCELGVLELQPLLEEPADE
jgi:hypothetical protein